MSDFARESTAIEVNEVILRSVELVQGIQQVPGIIAHAGFWGKKRERIDENFHSKAVSGD